MDAAKPWHYVAVARIWAPGLPDDIAMGFSEDRAHGKFGPFYLLVGDNPYVLWDAAEHWKSSWKRQAGESTRVKIFTVPQIDFDDLLGAGATMPMFETIQPVLIHDVDRLTGRKQDEFLRIVANASPSTKWLLTAESVDKRTTLYKTLAALGPVEVFPRIYPEHIGGWVQRIASDFEAALAPQAVELVASVHGADFFGVRQTIERAVLYIGKKRRIEATDIEVVLAGEGEYDVFQLLEAASRADFERSLEIARALLASAQGRGEVSVWLGMIHGQCLKFMQMLDMGNVGNDQIAQAMRIHPFLVSKLRPQAAGFGLGGLLHAIESAFEADWAIKTSTLSPRMAWELFVWRIARGRKRRIARLLDLESRLGRE